MGFFEAMLRVRRGTEREMNTGARAEKLDFKFFFETRELCVCGSHAKFARGYSRGRCISNLGLCGEMTYILEAFLLLLWKKFQTVRGVKNICIIKAAETCDG